MRVESNQAHQERSKRRAAGLSVASNTLLVGGKLAVGIYTSSVAVLSEAIHSAMDLLAAVIAMIAVVLSGRPPDAEHPHGHGKIENLSGAIEALLIFGAVVYIGYESVKRLLTGGEMHQPYLGTIVMAFSALLNTLVSWHLQRVGKRTDSMALLADAAHLRTDVYTSLGVVAGLGLFQLTGLLWLDSVTAMAVALLIVYEAWVITRRSVGDLLDESLPPEEQQAIERIMKERGVTYHSLRSRKSGPTRKIDLHLDVSPKATAEQVHELCDQVERDVEEALPHTQVLIHPEPMSQLDGTREVRWRVKRVLNAHQQRYVSYSDLCAHEATDGVHVALRLHVDGSLKVREARRLASQLETEIKQRVDAAAVYVCVEPPKPVPEPQAQGQDESDLGSEPV